MIFPRLFTCPTLSTSNFKIGNYKYYFIYNSPLEISDVIYLLFFFTEFEVNLIVVFEDDYLVTENFPIILNRH